MATANVVFIILNSAIKSRIVCDLAEKCYLTDKRTVIFAQKEEDCKKIDALLWTWKQQSFVPHVIVPTLSEPQFEPVVLTSQIESVLGYDTLLMLDPLPVEKLDHYQLVIDFAEKYDSQAIEQSRNRYKLYRDQQYSIDTMQPGEFLHSVPH